MLQSRFTGASPQINSMWFSLQAQNSFFAYWQIASSGHAFPVWWWHFAVQGWPQRRLPSHLLEHTSEHSPWWHGLSQVWPHSSFARHRLPHCGGRVRWQGTFFTSVPPHKHVCVTKTGQGGHCSESGWHSCLAKPVWPQALLLSHGNGQAGKGVPHLIGGKRLVFPQEQSILSIIYTVIIKFNLNAFFHRIFDLTWTR